LAALLLDQGLEGREGVFLDLQRIEARRERLRERDAHRPAQHAFDRTGQSRDARRVGGRLGVMRRTQQCGAQHCIGPMHGVPIGLLGHGRSGTDHRHAPSLARANARARDTPRNPRFDSAPVPRGAQALMNC
jgi:hypothetical protein